MEALEPKDLWYLLQGKIAHLHGKILQLRQEIQNITATISIENLGTYTEGSTLLPRIHDQIVDNALSLLDRAQQVIQLQEEYNNARSQAIKARDAHYELTKELL